MVTSGNKKTPQNANVEAPLQMDGPSFIYSLCEILVECVSVLLLRAPSNQYFKMKLEE